MLSQLKEGFDRHLIRLCAASVVLVLLLAFAVLPTRAQGNFNSGSTGADGPFSPTANQAVQLPPNGIFNFTTINIPAGVTITFIRNAGNTPVVMLAQGNVTIAGTINIGGATANGRNGGEGGPGGGKGGLGGLGVDPFREGITGDGPGGGRGGSLGGGGGYATVGGGGSLGGPAYGTTSLVPLLGGSGGGGSNAGQVGGGAGGGGGGILIASSGTITFISSGQINAQGGNGLPGPGSFEGGGGSGGAMRLVANVITGSVTLDVRGGVLFFGSPSGAPGRIRIESFDSTGFAPTILTSSLSTTTFGLPPIPFSPQTPLSLRIVSIAGRPAPTTPIGSLQSPPDVILPTAQTNPVDVVIQGANIPVGTAVQVTLTPETGARTTGQGTLAGTDAASTTTVSLTLPTSMQSVIHATAIIELTIASARPMFIDGERVDRIEAAASYGGGSEVTYITRSGKRIKKGD